MREMCDDDRCELNPEKLCDNCFRCLEQKAGQDYAEIRISAVYTGEDYLIDDTDADYADDAAGISNKPRIRAHTITGLHAGKRQI